MFCSPVFRKVPVNGGKDDAGYTKKLAPPASHLLDITS
jgi:hypothetical protein